MRFALPLILSLASANVFAQLTPPLVIPEATISSTHIAFIFGGQVWEVSRSGGRAKQLTQGPETHRRPLYSPDGAQLAFMRSDGGENNTYVMPARGGEARQITFHPAFDIPWAFSPDGKQIAISSSRGKTATLELLEASVTGGVLERRLPVPTGSMASYSPDGTMIAHVPRPPLNLNIIRRNERGGTRSRVEVFPRSGGAGEFVTPSDYNSLYPMWIGKRIYFVQDRAGSFNLACFDRGTRRIRELTSYPISGITCASTNGKEIVFVRDGRLFIVDPAEERPREVPVSIAESDMGPGMDERGERRVSASRFIQSFTMGPDGKSVVVESHGDALVKPARGGPAINHTQTPGIAEREPTLSPDGKWLAYFSDETGEYALHLRPMAGGAVRKLEIEPKPGYYTEPFWSPDSRSIVFSDRRLGLWVFDVESGKSTKIDQSTYMAQGLWNPAWSPDSRYLAYAKALPNHHRALFIWDRSNGLKVQLTDEFSHSEFPTFDASGRYLYFSGSANARNASASDIGWALLSDFDAQPLVLKRLFVMVLRPSDSAPVLPSGGLPNPLASFESSSGPVDWEKAKSRIVPLGITPRDITGVAGVEAGTLLVLVNDWDPAPGRWINQSRLYRLDLRRPTEFAKVADTANAISVASNRSATLIGVGGSLQILATGAPTAAEGQAAALPTVNLAQDMIDVAPRQGWKQMYREAWRIMREHFYDPNYHGMDIAALERHFAGYLQGLVNRNDLNALMRFAFGEVSISHLQVGGGNAPPPPVQRAAPPRTGLLGVDWTLENGRYRIAKVYRNGHFLDARPLTRAPLDQPGVTVRQGDYLIEVEGNPVTADRNIFSYFRGTAGRPTKLKFASDPSGAGAREVTAVPMLTEGALRLVDWTEANRRWVQEKSGGKLVYVHVDGFDEDGFDGVYRTVNGLRPGQGLIWDQRFNGGGITGDALVQMLMRKPMLGYIYPHGEPFYVSAHRVDGPVMLMVDQNNGSAAETFALMFKAMKAGTIVGTHTYGAGVGVALTQQRLIDGGRIGIPNRASHNPLSGEWEIENRGVAPDVEVDNTTADFLAGRDRQLEKAVEVGMRQLATWKTIVLKRPKYLVHPPGG